MQGEISYDLVMEDDMSFAEGAYRTASGDWRVFVFSKRAVERPEWRFCTWESGVGGLVFAFPTAMNLNAGSVEALLSQATGCQGWQRVAGPDSMTLR